MKRQEADGNWIVENDSIVLYGNSTATLYDNSTATLYDNSTATLCGNSTATLYDNSTATLYDNSTATLCGNSTATLYGNSTATLCDNSTATLCGNSTATLCDNSTATLYDFSHASEKGGTAKKVSPKATISKIDYPKSVLAWAAMKGIKPTGRGATQKIKLWKTVRENYGSFTTESLKYNVGETVIAPDWDATFRQECGCGLHLADSPSGAIRFVAHGSKFKLLEVEALVKDCVCIGGNMDYPMKIRARACKVLREVDPKDVK
jgi:hypothetical protein